MHVIIKDYQVNQECYSDTSGKKFGSNYNLNLFEFNTRTILEISNGYICLSGFGAGWF
jgi:hypothetical protein